PDTLGQALAGRARSATNIANATPITMTTTMAALASAWHTHCMICGHEPVDEAVRKSARGDAPGPSRGAAALPARGPAATPSVLPPRSTGPTVARRRGLPLSHPSRGRIPRDPGGARGFPLAAEDHVPKLRRPDLARARGRRRMARPLPRLSRPPMGRERPPVPAPHGAGGRGAPSLGHGIRLAPLARDAHPRPLRRHQHPADLSLRPGDPARGRDARGERDPSPATGDLQPLR